MTTVPDSGTVVAPEPPAHGTALSRRALAATALGALGVVYGDIGTSPLYALKECFAPDARRRRRPRPTSSACCRSSSGR